LFALQGNTLQHTLQRIAPHRTALQCTAACCTALQHIATHCNTLQHIATHGTTLHHTDPTATHTASHSTTLHHIATQCNTMHCTTIRCHDSYNKSHVGDASVAVCCSVLQCVAACVAVCCSVRTFVYVWFRSVILDLFATHSCVLYVCFVSVMPYAHDSHTNTCCNVLQCDAGCCSVCMQYVAPHSCVLYVCFISVMPHTHDSFVRVVCP